MIKIIKGGIEMVKTFRVGEKVCIAGAKNIKFARILTKKSPSGRILSTDNNQKIIISEGRLRKFSKKFKC